MRLYALNLKQARVTFKRSKNSLSTEQPMEGDELRAIKRYLNTREDKLPWLFVSKRGQPLTRQAVNYLSGTRPAIRARQVEGSSGCGNSGGKTGKRIIAFGPAEALNC